MDLRNKGVKSRGMRNNNPFNLRKSGNKWVGKVKGTDTDFETFDSVENGIRAGMIYIINDISLKKKNTLVSLINQFAPPNENDTNAYIKHLSIITGRDKDAILNPNNKINADFLYKLAAGIIAKEYIALEDKLIPAETIQEGVKRAITASQTKRFIQVDSTTHNPASGKILDASIVIAIIVLVFSFIYFKIKL